MSFHQDLLSQARQLAELDLRRPKQANLRRALSSAYYALFHLLIDAASGLYSGDKNRKAKIARTYQHKDMKQVAARFSRGDMPKLLSTAIAPTIEGEKLRRVAETFVSLQDARHEADYDLTQTFTRAEVLALVEQVQQAFDDWEAVKAIDDARLLLGAFQLWKKWDEEPR
jgi:uncharacterized protein (UPF0332 family)